MGKYTRANASTSPISMSNESSREPDDECAGSSTKQVEQYMLAAESGYGAAQGLVGGNTTRP